MICPAFEQLFLNSFGFNYLELSVIILSFFLANWLFKSPCVVFDIPTDCFLIIFLKNFPENIFFSEFFIQPNSPKLSMRSCPLKESGRLRLFIYHYHVFLYH